MRVEADRLVLRPAKRLDDAAFDLVADAAGVDRLATVDRGDGAVDGRLSGTRFDLDVERDRAIGAEVLSS